ncbi:MAG: hypothetical protein V2J08_14005 [Desulfotignum sp.]|jgi:hypothetical protein|nr:hypothetical protein [Desulfotignum sp.]
MEILHILEKILFASIWPPYLVGMGIGFGFGAPWVSGCTSGHGIIGILAGAGLYAAVYPRLKKQVLPMGNFGEKTLIDLVQPRNPWFVIIPAAVFMIGFMAVLEIVGL